MNKKITSVSSFIADFENLLRDNETAIFRGQTSHDPLLPKIARDDYTIDTTKQEIKILEEFRRRTAQDTNLTNLDDWDCLVYAQHYGMATRLLDWTTNPLVALWFACIDLNENQDGHHYFVLVKDDMMLDKKKDKSPFEIKHTKIFKPSINNPRIAAQDGWFTVHRYGKKDGKFVSLSSNAEFKNQVFSKTVKGSCKGTILDSLNRLGINHESIYTGLEGTCRHINWSNNIGT